MELESFKNVLDSLDYTIVDNNRKILGTENPEMIQKYIRDKRDNEYTHIDMFQLPYILGQIN